MAVRNGSGSGSHSVPKKEAYSGPKKGQHRCVACSEFYYPKDLIEIERFDRFDRPDRSVWVCKTCNREDGVVDSYHNAIHKYDHGTEGYGWVANEDPKRNWNWDEKELET
jgi:hypothetical protein